MKPTNNINEQLRVLIAEACDHPENSLERQLKLNHIYRLVMKSGKLWKEGTWYYSDALQDTFEYCFSHLEEYDASIKQVTTWIDDVLKKRLRRYRDAKKRQNERTITLPQNSEIFQDQVANLPAGPDIEQVMDIWFHTIEWLKSDPEELLCSTYFRNRPEINAQSLFLMRFPSETPWKKIAAQFKLTESEAKDLPKWYNRKCLPLLRKFGKDQGYI